MAMIHMNLTASVHPLVGERIDELLGEIQRVEQLAAYVSPRPWPIGGEQLRRAWPEFNRDHAREAVNLFPRLCAAVRLLPAAAEAVTQAAEATALAADLGLSIARAVAALVRSEGADADRMAALQILADALAGMSPPAAVSDEEARA